MSTQKRLPYLIAIFFFVAIALTGCQSEADKLLSEATAASEEDEEAKVIELLEAVLEYDPDEVPIRRGNSAHDALVHLYEVYDPFALHSQDEDADNEVLDQYNDIQGVIRKITWHYDLPATKQELIRLDFNEPTKLALIEPRFDEFQKHFPDESERYEQLVAELDAVVIEEALTQLREENFTRATWLMSLHSNEEDFLRGVFDDITDASKFLLLCEKLIERGETDAAVQCLALPDDGQIDEEERALLQEEVEDVPLRKERLNSDEPDDWLWLVANREGTAEVTEAKEKYLDHIRDNTLCKPWEDSWKDTLSTQSQLLMNMPVDLAGAASGEQPLQGQTGLSGLMRGLTFMEMQQDDSERLQRRISRYDVLSAEEDLHEDLEALAEYIVDTHERMQDLARRNLNLPLDLTRGRAHVQRQEQRVLHQFANNLPAMMRISNNRDTNPYLQFQERASAINAECNSVVMTDDGEMIDREDHLLRQLAENLVDTAGEQEE